MRQAIFICASLMFCGSICLAQEVERSEFERRFFYEQIVRPHLEVPDSLGGERLKGEVMVKLTIHRLGQILNSEVEWITMSLDSSEARMVYKSLGPGRRGVADTFLKRYSYWIDEYLGRLQIRFDIGHPYFARENTVVRHLVIPFNPGTEYPSLHEHREFLPSTSGKD